MSKGLPYLSKLVRARKNRDDDFLERKCISFSRGTFLGINSTAIRQVIALPLFNHKYVFNRIL